jgi:hypothetical protein
MFERIIGVLKLDAGTYDAIKADENATSQAVIIVAVIAVLAGIGAFAATQMANSLMSSLGVLADLPAGLVASATISPFGALVGALIRTFLAWIVGPAVIFFVGTSLFKGQATFNQLLRVIGFAQAPQVFYLLAFIPCLPLLVLIWVIATNFMAVRQGLSLDNGKAIGTVIVAIIAIWIVNFALGMLMNAIF